MMWGVCVTASEHGVLLRRRQHVALAIRICCGQAAKPDEYAGLDTGLIVYNDDLGDYSINEPIMDGTANMSYLFAAMARFHGARR